MSACPRCGEENPERARFCLMCAAPLSEQETAPEGRRTVTIVFSDLVGSTALGESLDSEALREVLNRYFADMETVLRRHGGTVEKFIGDAIMTVFGLQRANEDDALRAVRAAWEMRSALEDLNGDLSARYGVRLQSRTGVNTGEVIAGDPARGQRLVAGDAVNVAARLEQAAPPGEILLGEPTFRLVERDVIADAVAPLQVKGKSEPLPARLLVDAAPPSSAPRPVTTTPFVGRTDELEALLAALAEVERSRSCRLVVVVGPPGVGKSRLLDEFDRRLPPGARFLRSRCLSYGEGITFWPAADLVRQATGATERHPAHEVRALLRKLLEGTPDEAQVEARLASLVGASEATYPVQETFWAVRSFVEVIARTGPVVLSVEDVHWAEPTLLELLAHLAETIADAPVLVVGTARPEIGEEAPEWLGRTDVERLRPLAESDAGELIRASLGSTLDPELRRRVLEATGGNPLFVEQLLAMLVETGALVRSNGELSASGHLEAIPIPPTIGALLQARLDRLPAGERDVVGRASVVGQVFYREAVDELVSEPVRARVPEHLAALTRRELVGPSTSDLPGMEAHRFLHALIRDQAYAGLLKRMRAELHERFADWLVEAAGPGATELDEIVGHHLAEAAQALRELAARDSHGEEVARRAAERLVGAGERAMNREDLPAAVRLLLRAASLRPEGDPMRLRALAAAVSGQLALGLLDEAEASVGALLAEASAAGEEGPALLGRLLEARLELTRSSQYDPRARMDDARAVAERFAELRDDAGEARAWVLVSEHAGVLGELEVESDALARAIHLSRRAGSRDLESQARRLLSSHLLVGPTPAGEGIARLEAVLVEGDDLPQAVRAGALRALAGLLSMVGRFDEARSRLAEAAEIFERLRLPAWTAMGIPETVTYIELAAGDPAAAERASRFSFETLGAMGEVGFRSSAAANLALTLVEQGRFEEAIEISRWSEELAAPDDADPQVRYRAARALAFLGLGRVDDAERMAREAVTIAEGTQLLWETGEALTALGRVLLASGRREEAIEALHRALATYRRKGMTVYEERVQRLLQDS